MIAENSVANEDLQLQAGRVVMRDLLDAQDALLAAQNGLTAAIIQYRTAELQLQRDLDLLTITKEGLMQGILAKGNRNMTSNNNGASRSGGLKKKPYKIIGTAVLVVAIGLVIVWFKVVRGGEDPANTVATFVAKRGPLTISVLEAGALKAKDPEIIRNQVEGRTTIISIVSEGTRVNQGDLLIELDVSTLRDRRVDQAILVNNADAAYVNSKETLNITTSQADSDIDLAELKLEFAKQDLDKYTGKDGQYDNDYAAAEGTIAMNEAELKKDTDYYDWSQKLAKEKYLSEHAAPGGRAGDEASRTSTSRCRRTTSSSWRSTPNAADCPTHERRQPGGHGPGADEGESPGQHHPGQGRLAAKEQELQRQKDKLAKIDDQIAKAKVLRTDGGDGGLRDQQPGRRLSRRPPAAGGWRRSLGAAGADLPAAVQLDRGGGGRARGEPAEGAGGPAGHRHGRCPAGQEIHGHRQPDRPLARSAEHVDEPGFEGLQDGNRPGRRTIPSCAAA